MILMDWVSQKHTHIKMIALLFFNIYQIGITLAMPGVPGLNF